MKCLVYVYSNLLLVSFAAIFPYTNIVFCYPQEIDDKYNTLLLRIYCLTPYFTDVQPGHFPCPQKGNEKAFYV